MKNSLTFWGACLFLFLASCSNPETEETPVSDYFITEDLAFLSEGVDANSGKGWPANGCKEIEVKIKLPLIGEVTTKFYHCCVNFACNLVELTEVVNFFLGKKSGTGPAEIEIVSSEMVKFKEYEFRIRPGRYALDLKTGRLKGLQYEVWVNRK